MPNLTNDYLKNVFPPPSKERLEIRDSEERGLIFRVTDKGVRTWSVRYRNAAGEQRRKNLGTFPAIGLARARAEARKAKGDISTGVDPVGVQKEAKAAARRRSENTFGSLAEKYFTAAELGTHMTGNARPKRLTTIKEEQRIYNKHIKPLFEEAVVNDIRRADIQAFVDKVSKQAMGTGRQCRDVMRQVLSYAVRLGVIEFNPGIGVGAVQSDPRERVLNDVEIKVLWRAFEPPGVTLAMGLALRMGMVTIQRGSEVVGMRWSEINREARTWTIPGERMKSKRTHVIPLSDLALRLLTDAEDFVGGDDFVFQSPSKEVDAQMDRRGYTRAMNRIVKELKIPKATPHDFRRTGASNMTSERIGIPRFIAGAVLAHVENNVTGRHYDWNDYLPQKRQALDAWATLLESIVKGTKRPSNVLPMARQQ